MTFRQYSTNPFEGKHKSCSIALRGFSHYTCRREIDRQYRVASAVALMQQRSQSWKPWSATPNVARVLAWFVAALAMLNALCFVLRVSSPVIQRDAWYFFDVFLRKAIDGSLGLGDFFVKRAGVDHAQPLFKLEMLFEWRYFGLDFMVGAVVGVIAAAASVAILYRIVVAEPRRDGSDIPRCLGWAAMCAVLFSLNGNAGTWTWPLVALENITTLIILVFIVVVWHALKSQRYLMLAMVTLLLGISSDDSALIAVAAVVFAVLMWQICDSAQRRLSTWKVLAVIGVCMVCVRIGYAYAPIVGLTRATSISFDMGLLLARFQGDGWWRLAVLPLVLPVSYQSPFPSTHPDTWMIWQAIMGALLLVAHLLFWRKAFRIKYNLSIFVAVCLMLLFYGWVAGILVGRVANLGTDFVNQPRYILLYAGHLIALLLMWAESTQWAFQRPKWRHVTDIWVPAGGCLILLAVQIPLSIDAWHIRKAQWAYDANMANQIDQLVTDPAHVAYCLPEQRRICNLPLEERQKLIQMLSANRLNIFSPQVQQRHPYLPTLSPVPTGSPDHETGKGSAGAAMPLPSGF